MKIAVTGAFSYSGKYITSRLLARGEDVVTLTNHPNRPDPFAGKVKAFPLNFNNADELVTTLRGVDVLVNTYWIRFDKDNNTQPKAVENTKILVNAAAKAGVKRIVHISITNPSADSHLPYFWGKAANEKAVIDSGYELRDPASDRVIWQRGYSDQQHCLAAEKASRFRTARRRLLQALPRLCGRSR